LEFIGALASAATAAYGVPGDLEKGVVLFTGVVIPSSKKLWSDRWPGYKRNVVTYGVQDFEKVPRKSISGHKYLFFPKRDIQATISDGNLFRGEKTFARLSANPKLDFLDPTVWDQMKYGSEELVGPHVQVISLAFDSLEIPFDEVFTPGTVDQFANLFTLKDLLSSQITNLATLKIDAGKSVEIGGFAVALSTITNLSTTLPPLSIATNQAQTNVLLAVSNVVTNFVSKSQADIQEEQSKLTLRATELNSITKNLAAGIDPKQYEQQIAQIKIEGEQAGKIFEYYKTLAQILTKLAPALQNANSTPARAALLDDLSAQLKVALQKLGNAPASLKLAIDEGPQIKGQP
jgi:hypothetical protein